MLICYNYIMKNWLINKNVVVTGASSGIGKDITKILINKYNCFVVGVARNIDKLNDLKNYLGEHSNKFEFVSADVSKKEDWKKIKDFCNDKNITVLINNAGTMLPFTRADKVEAADVERLFNVNFFSTIYGYKTFCEEFRKDKNCAIANIASVAAVTSLPGTSYYSASKSALCSFSKIIASEERKNFFIGTYLPGMTSTNLFTNKDNKKPVFDEKTGKLFNKFSTSSEKMAKKIVKCLAKKKRFKVLGKDAKLLKFLNSLMPIKSSDLYYNVMKKTKLSSFEDIF